MRDMAVAYAKVGYSVLACYTVYRDDEDGQNYCTCGNFNCKSPGKHPIPEISPSGSLSATNDPDVVANWPDQRMNIGVAGGGEFPEGGFLCLIDVDDDDTAAKMKTVEELREMPGVVHTGRQNGLHFHVLTSEKTASGILYTTEGLKLGEVRSEGQYCVVPPSTHYSGNQYEWVGPSVFDAPLPHFDGDGWAYAAKVLGLGKIEAAPKHQYKDVPPFAGKIDPEGALEKLGFQPSTLITDFINPEAILTDKDGKPDRSDSLYWLACQIWREVALLDSPIVLAPEQVAAVLKAKDMGWASVGREPKWLYRNEATQRYWECANRAYESVQNDPPQPLASPPVGGYGWDGTWFGKVSPNLKMIQSGNRYASFEPRIIERLRDMDSGMDDWLITAKRQDEEYNVRLRPEEWASDSSFPRELTKRLPSNFYVVTNKRKGLLEAVSAYSGNPPMRIMRKVTGWIDERDAFLLPDRRGAIVADGFDPVTLDFDKEGVIQPRLFEDASVEEGLRLLMASAPPSIVVPITAQILAAPLTSIVLHDKRSLVHLWGPTNSFKTTLIEALFGLYGYSEKKQEMGVHSWSATTLFILDAAYVMRDMPMLVDDFKTEVMKPADITRLVQALGDEQQRSRLTSRSGDVVRAGSKEPRALALSTGEDVWFDQKSKLTRTFVVPIREEIEGEPIFALQRWSQAGYLSAVGVAWIRWLCKQGRKAIPPLFSTQMEKMRTVAMGFIPAKEHPRLLHTTTSLMAAFGLFDKFVAEEMPGYLKEFRQDSKAGWLAALQNLSGQAEQAQTLAPAVQIRDMLDEMLATGRASLAPRLGTGAGMKGIGLGGPIVGWWDYDSEAGMCIYLTKDTTWAEVEIQFKRRGIEPKFGWENFTSDLKYRWDAVYKNVYREGHQKKMWQVSVNKMGLRSVIDEPVA